MSEAWHAVPEAEAVGGIDGLELPRARAIGAAVQRHPDFSLVQCLRAMVEGQTVVETLVVEVKCHGVPHSNPHGIAFRERLALRVSSDDKKMVEVLALRLDFPVLMHQNQVIPGSAPSLCLYYEPVRAVLRTWTPQNFLRRIQLWLEKTADGSLHPADQPVEQLFFTTPYELILPWDFQTLSNDPAMRFVIVAGPKRPDRGQTYFLVSDQHTSRKDSTSPIEVTLPTIVHGRPETDPPTLGGLTDTLSQRGIDLQADMIRAIQSRVPDEGVPIENDDAFTVLLLHIPVSRQEGGIVERIARRAYLLAHGTLKLGVSLGALYTHDKRYFKEQTSGLLASATPQTDWRSNQIDAVEVLFGIDPQKARLQSGVKDEGPAGVLIGAGALGAAMLDLWTRSGWGTWSVVDKDHIKPHNLVRHPADGRHIGGSKAEVAAHRHGQIMQGAGTMTAIHADACELDDVRLDPALRSAQLVVDISTTLEYPRLASTREEWGRHASGFATPNGQACVLLLEDKGRHTRLRTLEAQYYREAIHADWGHDHLNGNLGTYWSGASCRDISMVMPYSRITAHAATLAEHLMRLNKQDGAAICVWCHEPETGAVAAHAVPVQAERMISLEELSLFIDEGVVAKMVAMRQAKLPCETGGILLGYHDFNVNAVVVVDASAAPPDSQSSERHFKRGIQGVSDFAAEAGRRTAGIVGYIGEWHSHPPGCSANPSADDIRQLSYLAHGMAQEGLPALSLIVGTDGELQVLQGSITP